MVKKRMLIRDTVREIRHTMGRFLSILCITALGTSFFAGIRTASPVMERSFQNYARQSRLMDIRFVSTVGFDEDDVTAIQSLPGISTVYPTYQFDVLAEINNKNSVVTLLSAPQGSDALNLPTVLSGRLPQNGTECAIEGEHFDKIKIGDTIPLKSGTDDPLSDTIKTDHLTVVGRVDSPLYTSLMRGSSTIGSGNVDGYIMVHPSLFSLDVYTDVYALVDKANSVGAYSDAYDSMVGAVIDQSKSIGEERAQQWYTDTVAKAKDELADNQKKYDDAVKSANAKFRSAQKQIDDGLAQIQDGESQLTAAREQLAQRKEQGMADIQAAREQWQQAYDQYEQAYKGYLANKDSMTPEEQQAAEENFAGQKAQLDAQAAAIDANEQELLKTVAQTQVQLDAQQSQLDAGKKELQASQDKLNSAKRKANREFADAREKLTQAQKDIDDIPTAKWYVLGRDANAGYVEYKSSTKRIDSVAKVFPVFFFFIAALVCLTTMTRMVDEQRGNMGTFKALGYSKGDIAAKYLLYAAFPSVLGSIVGIAVGMRLFPYAIFKAYAMMFSIPGPDLMMHWPNAILAASLAVGICIAATLIACYEELHNTPASLMRPRAPKPGKLILLERAQFLWKRLNFTSKVTARNLFRYKRRLFMTIAGIMGCTALLLTGFGIRDSIKTIVQNQYGKINLYQISVGTKDDLSEPGIQTVEREIKNTQGVDSAVICYEKTMDFNVLGKDQSTQVTLTVFDDDTDPSPWINILDMRTQQTIPLPQSGAIVDAKLAKEMGIKAGDILEMQDDNQRYPIKVVGFCENYIRHVAYMSEQAYTEATGKSAAMNHFFINSASGTNLNGLCETLLKIKNITQVNAYTQASESLNDAINGLNGVILVLILAAAALAFVVMYNLTNINIGERIREIATLKVLGFTGREVAAYVFRENILLSLLGTVLGCGGGILMHRYVMSTVEIEGMMFGRQIFPMSFVISAALTLVFAGIVNFVMLPRLNRIDMVESLKTVE